MNKPFWNLYRMMLVKEKLNYLNNHIKCILEDAKLPAPFLEAVLEVNKTFSSYRFEEFAEKSRLLMNEVENLKPLLPWNTYVYTYHTASAVWDNMVFCTFGPTIYDRYNNKY